MLKLQKRIVDVKRHTIGYIVNGERMTRGAVVKLARRNKFEDVTARRGRYSWFVASRPSSNRKLYSLPLVLEL